MRKSSFLLMFMILVSLFVVGTGTAEQEQPQSMGAPAMGNPELLDGLFEEMTSSIDNPAEQLEGEIMPELMEHTTMMQEMFPASKETMLTVVESNSISTNEIYDEVHSPGRDSYIIDFGYHYTQSLLDMDPYSIYDGWLGAIILGASLDMDIDLFIPANVTYVYNQTAVAGKPLQVDATLYDAGPMTFTVSFTLGLEGTLRLGPSLFGVEYPLDMEFVKEIVLYQGNIPYEPYRLEDMAYNIDLLALLSNILVPGLGDALSSLFDIDLILTPQINVDLVADLSTEDMPPTEVHFPGFDTQSFFIKPPQALLDGSEYHFQLDDFELLFDLSLVWTLHFGFNEAGPLSFLNSFFKDGFNWDFLTFPTLNFPVLPDSAPRALATGDLEVVADVNAYPEFHIDSYTLTEDNSNGIMDPDESGQLGLDLYNHGDGPSLETNITYSSSDFTGLSGTTTLDGIVLSDENAHLDLDFTVPVAYAQDNGNITITLSMLRPSGAIITQDLVFMVRVLQPGESYVNQLL